VCSSDLAICLLFTQTFAVAELKTVDLATGEWEPYTSESMPSKGAFTEIVSAAFQDMGIKPRYGFYPWKRAEIMTQYGEIFAVFPYKITDERKLVYHFSDPVMKSTGRFFYYKKYTPQEPLFRKLSDLSSIKIGGVLGYWYEPLFTKEKLSMEYVATDSQNLMKLYSNRVQLMACDELVGWAMIKKKYPNEVTRFGTLSTPMNQDDLRLMVSQSYPNSIEILKAFNASLHKLKKNGKIAAILEKYNLKD
jgi:polar amino acid transport system substrate-binding protein